MLYDITYNQYIAEGLPPAKAFAKAIKDDLRADRTILCLQLIRNLFDIGLAASKKLVDSLLADENVNAADMYIKHMAGVLPSDCTLEEFSAACNHLLSKREYGTLGRLLATHRNDDWPTDYQMYRLLINGTATIESLYLPGNATSNFRYIRID